MRLQILRLAQTLSFLVAGAISLSPAIQTQYPLLQDSRQTPTNAPRVRITATFTFPPRQTNTSPPPTVRPSDTETSPLQSAAVTPTATINQKIQQSDTPPPTTPTQTLDIATHTPTPEVPGYKQPKNPFNQGSSIMPIVITAVFIVVTTILLTGLTYSSTAGLIVALVIPAAALLGGVISSSTGGDFWDGFMLGVIAGSVPPTFTSIITNIIRSLKKKKKRD
jgi:hypothetical protein